MMCETNNIVLEEFWFEAQNIWIIFNKNEGSLTLPFKRADLSKFKVYLIAVQPKKELQ